MYSIGQFLCAIQTNRWAFAFCASLGPGFLVEKRGKKLTREASMLSFILILIVAKEKIIN